MQGQSGFMLLPVLYLSNIFAVVQAASKIHVLTDQVPLHLTCENSLNIDSVEWQQNGKNISEVYRNKSTKEALFHINNNGTLSILRNEENAYGNYTCIMKSGGNSSTLSFRVVPKPTLELPTSPNAVEGEKFHLECSGKHLYPGIKIQWLFNGMNYTSDSGRVKLKAEDSKITNAMLTVDKIEITDRGIVSCFAAYNKDDMNNSELTGFATTTLSVKDKLAALWPFLGICAEVFVLCAIILIYEKKRNKSELEESDTDQSPDTKPAPNKDSDVRQRK